MRAIEMTVLMTCLLSGGVALPRPAAAADAAWTHALYVYGMGAAIDGTSRIGPLAVDVSLSASDVFDALEFGAMAAYRADNGTWSYTVDATFMALGGSSSSEAGRVKGTVDIDQLTLMGTAGRRLNEHVEALLSLAYFDLSAGLAVTTTVPVTGEIATRTAGLDASWVDPLVGLQFSAPLGERWRVGLRADVGGFGVGSNLTYHALASLRWQAGERTGLYLGYRLIAFDYESGRDLSYQRYDLTEQGPLLGFGVSF